jgi:hypothetical protein
MSGISRIIFVFDDGATLSLPGLSFYSPIAARLRVTQYTKVFSEMRAKPIRGFGFVLNLLGSECFI